MNINQLKRHAKVIEDNRQKAAENWSKSWGFDIWYNLWAYRVYEYGRFKYKSGKVSMRHYGYQKSEFYIDGQSVTEYRFKKELAKEPEPHYEPNEPLPTRTTKKRTAGNSRQLEIEF